MSDGTDELRSELDQLYRELVSLREGQTQIVRSLDTLNGKVGRMHAEIGYGIPEPDERHGRATLRDRMHNLENEDNIAKAIHDSYARTFGRWQKIGLFGFASIAAVEGLLRLIGVGG